MTKFFVDKRLRQVTVEASLFLFEVAILIALMTKAVLNGLVMAPTCDDESCSSEELVAALSYDMNPQMVRASVSFTPQRGRITTGVTGAQTIIGGNCFWQIGVADGEHLGDAKAGN